MISPCISCEFKSRPKSQCTDIKNYCQKLLNFQRKLDGQDHSVRTTQFNNELPISLGRRKGRQPYDFY